MPHEIIERLQNIDARRIADMDATGISMQILSLTSPGVQVFDAATAVAVARDTNDQLAAAIAKYPTRLAGLAAVAPQNPREAARELERGVRALGLKGAILNSHTLGEYLDDPKFWDLFAAARSPGCPRVPASQQSVGGTDPTVAAAGPGWRHLRIRCRYRHAPAGDHHQRRSSIAFPKLKLVVGHLGEALPFWLFRLDYMHRATVASRRYAFMKPLQRKVSDYMRENVYVTSSGMAWAPAIQFCQQVLGEDRVMYAMDYPYQFEATEVVAMDSVGTVGERQVLRAECPDRLWSLDLSLAGVRKAYRWPTRSQLALNS